MNAQALPHAVRTTCPYCGVGCGVIATPDGQGGATISGDPAHPANFGQLCVKGTALGETLGTAGRLSVPLIDRQPSTWARATAKAADILRRTIAGHGPDSVAIYLSGQLLTEDYYVANKFAKGFLGTPHVDTNSRLCMASSVAGHRRAFGSDTVPNCYEDLDRAKLIVLVGSNAAWCHPVLFRRMQKARELHGARLVNIDPRLTATGEGSDLHLPVRPGMDGVIWSYLLVEIARRGATDQAFVADHCAGFDEALDRACQIAPDLATAARLSGLAEADLARFVDLWIATPEVVSCYSQGVNQSAQGTDKVNAILNCHLATGRIGKPGCGPLSLTGQPNAMGGREVGGLANMLAAHMGFSDAERGIVADFWQAPNLVTGEGLKAVQMFEAIAQGRIRALWVMCTNPAVSLPQADTVRAALAGLDGLIVSESHAGIDGLLDAADVVFPATPWGEKDGTVTNSERRISRQRAFLPAFGEARPDWKIICDVATAMGFGKAFSYRDAAAIFREHAALSASGNAGQRAFDIGAFSGLTAEQFDALEPTQWPVPAGNRLGTPRLFAGGGFTTTDARARLVAIAPPALAAKTTADAPLWLNTGRVRDHWHTMSRTRLSPRLNRHIQRPYLEIHPEDAADRGIAPGDMVDVSTASQRAVVLEAVITDTVPRGSVFAPIHWNDLTAGQARIGALVHAATDPVSGQPEAKATPVAVSRAPMASHGILLTRRRIEMPGWLSHVRVMLAGGEAVLFSSRRSPGEMAALFANFLPSEGERITLDDAELGLFRSLVGDGHAFVAALAIAPTRDEALFNWLMAQFARGEMAPAGRRLLLAGRDLTGIEDQGPIICACLGVATRVIATAIAHGASTVDAVGAACSAGTNCGSCRPDISRLIRAAETACHDQTYRAIAQPA